MALFENFPYTNLHELNLDWIIERIKEMEETSVLSVNGQTGYVILYPDAKVEFPEVTENQWSIVRTADGVESGILFDSNGTAYIVKGQLFDKLYSESNPPAYPVTSVNGLTGNVELFTEQYIRLPNLTDEEMHQWNFYRHINGIISGIQLSDDGSAYIMNGSQRYKIYSQNDQPPYPVESVNGQTGAVVLYPNADVVLPELTTGSTWTIKRTVAGIEIGLEFDTNGHCSLILGQDNYPLYIEDLNFPSDFDDPSAVILELSEVLESGTQWGIVRSVQNDDLVGIVFAYNSADQVYEGYLKVNNTLTKLLTINDIPSTTGVVSVNGLTGVVTLTGSNLHVSNSDSTFIATKFNEIDSDLSNLENGLAIIVSGTTSTQNITAGDLVLVINSTITNVSNGLYKAVHSVAAGTPLTSADLENTSTAKGGLNAIRAEENYYTISACTNIHANVSVRQNFIEQIGHTVYVSFAIDITGAIGNTTVLMNVPAQFRPSGTRTSMFALLDINDTRIRVASNNIRMTNSGDITQNLTNSWSSGYIEALFIYQI